MQERTYNTTNKGNTDWIGANAPPRMKPISAHRKKPSVVERWGRDEPSPSMTTPPVSVARAGSLSQNKKRWTMPSAPASQVPGLPAQASTASPVTVFSSSSARASRPLPMPPVAKAPPSDIKSTVAPTKTVPPRRGDVTLPGVLLSSKQICHKVAAFFLTINILY